ncbi:hypothetical protein HMPREF3185_00428 [Porphyromonas somerae]|uniref:Uncharacterized protein n=1 Tax=Porphyromonas somerae TaxID=322095 RepID=A0A134BCM0_9PORP|nr:hypothetical protein HMPREF3184_00428 [Porphyromonadaceae bacterium KA00676]KXB77671.1 hypothetical protein HMPREF3185_00428 [Porphyromonas somerae]
MVSERTSTGRYYRPVLVTTRSSSGHFTDHYWSEKPSRCRGE